MEDSEDNPPCKFCGKKHEGELKDRDETIEIMASSFTEEAFEDFWKSMKEELKSMSKKEMAEEIFFQAIRGFLNNFLPERLDESYEGQHELEN